MPQPSGLDQRDLIWTERKAGMIKHSGRARRKQPLVDPTAASVVFNHDSTRFPLEGTHAKVDCRSCHASLVFDAATNECVSCHTDVHAMTVGNDCARCHTQMDWMVHNVPELHEQNGFALMGAHGNLSCTDCHTSGNTLQFERVGNDCISCHRDDYLATTSPSHVAPHSGTASRPKLRVQIPHPVEPLASASAALAIGQWTL